MKNKKKLWSEIYWIMRKSYGTSDKETREKLSYYGITFKGAQ
jgi:hypothetical protein